MGSRKRQKSSASSSESEDDEDKRTLFIAHLDTKTTEEILFELFLQAGPIESVRIPKDKETQRQKTFGFVTYKYSCAIPYALRLYDGIKLFGQRLVIKGRDVKESNNSRDSKNYDRKHTENSSLRYGFKDKAPEIAPNLNDKNKDLKQIRTFDIEHLKRFAPELVQGVNESFENPFKATGSKHVENFRNDFKHHSRNDSRFDRREKPYQKPNRDDRQRNYSHRDGRRSEQRKNR
ncbi:RNA-binding protein 7 [Condylostylus longicornis]|uniref:RNA-binding protein 7 n=1 Tax=Condylostylus longicornis TaxID=2530218 RepID=UPI00244E34E0|nr:RNA-binding protein 7 [Condylostylus longicornis]